MINKTYSRNGPGRKGSGTALQPGAVVAVEREVVSGVPADISDQLCRAAKSVAAHVVTRFARLTNGFSKQLENHCAAVSLYVAHYNFCRVHEACAARRRWRLVLPIMYGRLANCWMRHSPLSQLRR